MKCDWHEEIHAVPGFNSDEQTTFMWFPEATYEQACKVKQYLKSKDEDWLKNWDWDGIDTERDQLRVYYRTGLGVGLHPSTVFKHCLKLISGEESEQER